MKIYRDSVEIDLSNCLFADFSEIKIDSNLEEDLFSNPTIIIGKDNKSLDMSEYDSDGIHIAEAWNRIKESQDNWIAWDNSDMILIYKSAIFLDFAIAYKFNLKLEIK